jgi:hypothetical protein
MNERIKQLALQAGFPPHWTWPTKDGYLVGQVQIEKCEKFAALVEAAARADEREFIAEKWERLYGYDKQGVAEFIRKRANTQGEQT